ncbi:DedA family protein [Fictibacillus enclensis]|uniref:DedA family protein n=1 Tax=Fictibacillus enclensis TaxID=1017270 RepID=UPI0025A0BA9E|nr:DedA family protein [Fictibacillus enclensis]MDM5336774.1 DedA family protein [Fictibacillus enclensis]
MSLDTVISYLQNYGHWIILLVLFCGITGIPAPEESFLFLVGVLVAKGHLEFGTSFLYAFMGTVAGMFASYWLGRKLGLPFIERYGKFIKITPDRWKAVEKRFHEHAITTLLFGFYLPGLRQLAPYIAGISTYSFLRYVLLSVLGSGMWTAAFISIGYFFGDQVKLSYLPWIAAAALLLFVLTVFRKKFTNKA